MKKLFVFSAVMRGFACAAAFASAPALYPVAGLTAQDMPYDAGGVVLLKWRAMPYDGPFASYQVLVSSSAQGPWMKAAAFRSDKNFSDGIKLPFWAWSGSKNAHALRVELSGLFPVSSSGAAAPASRFETRCYCKVVATDEYGARAESAAVPAVARANWFSLPRLNNLVYALGLWAVFLWFIMRARRKDYFLRRLPGLDALDGALGRAAETGRPVYYLTGRLDISSMSTIAAVSILGNVAEKTAAYGAALKVPHIDPLTMTVCQEIVRQSYASAARPDAYRDDMNFFLSSEQFAYTAAVDGMIARDRPAACIYTGYYYAESLLLAEVGASVGAVQIAATDAEHQLPFFFTTCDYTLMGEELYAASAYLSRDPVQVGTLRGQDAGKAAVLAIIALGLLATTLGTVFGWRELVRVVTDPVTSF
ncbi:MAG: hypothetical protein PHW69_00485 [Elusimicrobiaceae bacterium]|nr:hypothetical protein [Elusimicrobiaceae bacterium]